MPKKGYVYILASRRNGTLYIGVTADFNRRTVGHREGSPHSFTGRYGVYRLVYCELHDDIADAIAREKAMKNGIVHGS